jgi:type IV secretion system protein VirD4
MGDNADAKGSVLEWVEAMAGSFNPVVEAEASGFKGRPYNRRSQDLDSLKRHMAVWGNPGLQRATEASDFRLEALKRENISVYVQVPITRMKHYSSFLRMFFALATDVMTREHGEAQTPVLVFLNEFTNIGPLEHFLDDLTFVLGYGVRYWFFVQELAQLRALYPTKWESLFNSCQARVFMDIEEIPLLEYLSGKYLGNQTVAVEGFSASESYSAKQTHEDAFGWKTTTTGSGGASSSVSLVGRPVMTVDELRAMLTAKADGLPVGSYAMAVCQGERPFLVKRPFWFRRRGLASMLEAGKAALPAAENGLTGRVGI